MKKTTRIIVIVITLLFIAGIALFPKIKEMLGKDGDTPKSAPSVPLMSNARQPLSVNAKVLKPESLTDVINVTGNIIPDEEVDLSFESSGKITDIYFKEGSSVKKGQLLAKVNDAPLQAELQKLEAQLPLATERVYRQNALLEKDAVSQEAYDQVTTELEKLNADIALVKSRILQTELRAPFDGVIGLRQMSEGAYVSPTTIIAKLTKIVPLKIEFPINEHQANYVRPGTPIHFSVSKDQEVYKASVYAVESSIDLSTRSLKVRATYPNTRGLLKPGFYASVQIISNEIENALVVPNESIIAEMGRDIVYLYSEGKAKQVEIQKGLRTESDMQVLQGLHEGDTLITTGVMQLRDGLPVNIAEIEQ